jgi:hypothetical protein
MNDKLTVIVHFFSSVAHVWVRGAKKLLGRSLKSNFFGSEKFQVSAHVLPK